MLLCRHLVMNDSDSFPLLTDDCINRSIGLSGKLGLSLCAHADLEDVVIQNPCHLITSPWWRGAPEAALGFNPSAIDKHAVLERVAGVASFLFAYPVIEARAYLLIDELLWLFRPRRRISLFFGYFWFSTKFDSRTRMATTRLETTDQVRNEKFIQRSDSYQEYEERLRHFYRSQKPEA